MPLIQEQVVELHHWLDAREFSDLITISQMTPGPIAINSATFVGSKIAGVWGALAATFGCIFPACILVTGLAFVYLKYRNLSFIQGILNSLRPAVVAMIGGAGLTILLSSFFGDQAKIALENLHLDNVVIFLGAIALLRWKRWNPILVMSLCGVVKVAVQLALQAFGI